MGAIRNSIWRLGGWLLRTAAVDEAVRGVLETTLRPWDQIYGVHTQNDYDKLVQRYVSWVYACVTTISESVAQVPLRLYAIKPAKNTTLRASTKAISPRVREYMQTQPHLQGKLAKAVDVVEVMEHPFLDLMDQVNPFMNSLELIWYWIMYQELTGNAYTLIVKNDLGVPSELWILPAQNMKVVPSKDTFIKGYLYGKDPRTQQRFEPEEVIHMKYPNPSNLYYGMGPMAAGKLCADMYMAMTDYEYNLLQNSAIPRSALTTEQVLLPKQLERLKAEWNNAYKGTAKAGKLAILQGGLKVDPLSLSPREMGHIAGKKVAREEIAGVFRVPMSLLTMEDIKAAPAEGQRVGNTMFLRHTVRPKCKFIEQKLNEHLMPMYDPKLFCMFDDPVGEDQAFRLKEMEARLKVGYTSINMERQDDNQEPVEWGDVPIMPMGMVPFGTAPAMGVVPGQQSALSSSLLQGAGLATDGPASLYYRKYFGENTDAFRFVDPDDLPPQRDTIVAIIKRLFRLQAKEVAGKIKAAKAKVDGWLPDKKKWNAYLVQQSKPQITRLVVIGGNNGLERLGIATAFDVSTPEAQEFIKKHTFKFSSAVNAETNDILRKSLADGLTAGESVVDLRKRVATVFADMAKYRADRIARTESARAMSAGTEQAWKGSGVVDAKEWNGASDMCEFCQTMNAQFGPGTGGISLGGTFVAQGDDVRGTDGGVMSMTYGPVDYPPIHPHCRCDLIPVLKE